MTINQSTVQGWSIGTLHAPCIPHACTNKSVKIFKVNFTITDHQPVYCIRVTNWHPSCTVYSTCMYKKSVKIFKVNFAITDHQPVYCIKGGQLAPFMHRVFLMYVHKKVKLFQSKFCDN